MGNQKATSQIQKRRRKKERKKRSSNQRICSISKQETKPTDNSSTCVASPIIAATFHGRHMHCYRSCSDGIIAGSSGGSLMAATFCTVITRNPSRSIPFPLVLCTRFTTGRFIRVFTLAFFALKTWDAGAYPTTAHTCRLTIRQLNSGFLLYTCFFHKDKQI